MVNKSESVGIKFYVLEKLRNEFKAECARHGRSMGEALAALMQIVVESPELFFDRLPEEEISIANLIASFPDLPELAKNSYIPLERLQELLAGAYASDRELIGLARVLLKNGKPRHPIDLKMIRDRTFLGQNPE